MKLLADIILEEDGVTIIPAGTYLIVESAADLPKMYDSLKQLNPGMTFYGSPPDITVQFRSGGRIGAAELAQSDIIPLEWKQAAQAEGYQDIIQFIKDAQLAPWEGRGI